MMGAMVAPLSPPSCPGLTRLRGRSPFGVAKARASTTSFLPAKTWMAGTSPAMTRLGQQVLS